MPLAAWIGTTVTYRDYFQSVVIETTSEEITRVTSVSRQTFDYLYYKLDQFTAAMKSDCIEYAVNDPMLCVVSEQPEWYTDACADGFIYDGCNGFMFYGDDGEIAISPGSVILRNFKGELRYMEYDEFSKYFDIPGSEFIE